MVNPPVGDRDRRQMQNRSEQIEVEHQRSVEFDRRQAQLRDIQLIDEIAREKAVQALKDRRELWGDAPIELFPYETQSDALVRKHRIEANYFNRVFNDYRTQLRNEIERPANPSSDIVRRLESLELQFAVIKREHSTDNSASTSNQAPEG